LKFEASAPWEELPGLISKAIQIGTPKAWRRRADSCAAQVKENPLSASYLNERFGLELAMARVRQHLKVTHRLPDKNGADPSIQRLYAFVAMLGRVFPGLSANAQNRLAGKIRGGLLDDVGLESTAFELHIGSHLLAMGFEIAWNDLEHGGGYDLLISKEGLEAEVECKSFSGDIGRQIHKRRLVQLGGLINEALAEAFQRIGSTSVEVRIPKRLNGNEIPDIADRIRQAVREQVNIHGPSPCEINIRPLEIAGSPFDQDAFPPKIDPDAVQNFVQERFGFYNPNVLVQMHRQRGVMLLMLRSQRADNVVGSIYRALKEGATQFSGDRPAILCAHMLDVSPEQLVELDQDPNPSNLDRIATRLRRADNRKYLHTITFSAPGAIQYRREQSGRIVRNHRREIGPMYAIPNLDHPLYREKRLQIFA